MKSNVVNLNMRRRQRNFLRQYGVRSFLADVGFRGGLVWLFGNEAYYTKKECGL